MENPIGRTLNRKPAFTNNILAVLWTLLLANPLLALIVYGKDSFSKVVIASTLILGAILVIYILQDGLKIGRLKKNYLLYMLIIGISFIVNGVYFGVIGYLAMGVTFLIVVPACNMIFASANLEKAYMFMAKGTVLAFILYTIFAFLCGPPIDENQYPALMGNSNAVGGFATVVVPAILYLIMKNNRKERRIYVVILILLLAASVSICYFANARTCFLALLMQLAYVAIVMIVKLVKKEGRASFKTLAVNAVIIVICSIVMFNGTFFMMTSVKQQIEEKLPSIQIEVATDKPNYEIIPLDERVELSGERFMKGIFAKGEFTSGRIEIWPAFIQEVGFMGHASESLDVVTVTKKYKDTNAHNYYIQMAYTAGLIAGLTLLVFTFNMIVDLLKAFFLHFRGREYSVELIGTTCFALAFVLTSITSGGYMLYTYFIPTFMWLFGYPLFMKKEKK